ncbi:hypothetical protein CBS14141_004228 [Malassezia furfur]|nr:hypothetical protein CBS14141_004228 [Malassezia furfur]
MSFGNMNDGRSIPQIGLGSVLKSGEDTQRIVEYAIKTGYRHLDLAKAYKNQRDVGAALKKVIPAKISREELFITSKVWNNMHSPEDVERSLNDTLEELGVDYLDLFLMHWPVAFDAPMNDFRIEENGWVKLDFQHSVVDTWKAMIAMQKTGKVKSIGVSNFRPDIIDAIVRETGVKPVVNQIEAHPLLPQDDWVEYHRKHDIVITAYAPLGNNMTNQRKIVDYPQVATIASRRKVSPSQVLIAWGVRRGYVVIPRSSNPEHIVNNYEQIELSDEEYKQVSSLVDEAGGPTRFFIPYKTFNPRWDINVFNEPEEKEASHQIKVT